MFMGRITHREGRRDGEGIDRHGLGGLLQSIDVERTQRVAIVIVTAADERHRHAGEGLGESDTRHHRRIEPDEQDADGAAVAFHNGIRRQRG